MTADQSAQPLLAAMLGRLARLCVLLFVMPASALPDAIPLNMGFYLPAIRDANTVDLKISLGVWAEEIAEAGGYIIVFSGDDLFKIEPLQPEPGRRAAVRNPAARV